MSIATVKTGNCQSLFLDSEYLGVVTGGTLNDAEAPQHRRGIGGVDRLVAGYFTPRGSVQFLPTTNSLWLQTTGGKIKRGATGYPCSAMPTFDITYVSEEILTWSGCRASSVGLSSRVGEPLSGTLEFMATSIATDTLPSPASPLGDHWEWFDAVITFEGNSYAVQSFTATQENDLTPGSDMDGFTGGASHRTPKIYFPGDERTRLQIQTGNPIPNAVRGNLDDSMPSTLTFVSTFINGAGDTLALTLDNLINATGENPLEGQGGPVFHSYSFEGVNNSNSMTLAVTPA